MICPSSANVTPRRERRYSPHLRRSPATRDSAPRSSSATSTVTLQTMSDLARRDLSPSALMSRYALANAGLGSASRSAQRDRPSVCGSVREVGHRHWVRRLATDGRQAAGPAGRESTIGSPEA